MTCKDCMHYDVCHRRINSIDFLPVINGKIGKSPVMFKNCDDVETHCKHFKDKSKYIELPCKVGDEVYVIKNNKIQTKDVVYYNKIHSRIAEQNEEYWHCVDKDRISINTITFYPEDFGKTVFLTESEAEQKLKEKNNAKTD